MLTYMSTCTVKGCGPVISDVCMNHVSMYLVVVTSYFQKLMQHLGITID